MVGNVGAEMRMNFAMVGEAVNTAHRLVDMAADGQIVVSASIYQALAEQSPRRLEDSQILTSLGEVSIKGKIVPEVLYRVSLKRTERWGAPCNSPPFDRRRSRRSGLAGAFRPRPRDR